MTKYKFENEEGTTVKDLETGQLGIHKGVWLWRPYKEWLDEGNVTEPFKTDDELAADEVARAKAAVAKERRGAIEVVVEAEGMKQYTVAQVDTYLENQLSGMTLSNGDKLILFKILKKIAHRVL